MHLTTVFPEALLCDRHYSKWQRHISRAVNKTHKVSFLTRLACRSEGAKGGQKQAFQKEGTACIDRQGGKESGLPGKAPVPGTRNRKTKGRREVRLQIVGLRDGAWILSVMDFEFQEIERTGLHFQKAILTALQTIDFMEERGPSHQWKRDGMAASTALLGAIVGKWMDSGYVVQSQQDWLMDQCGRKGKGKNQI